MTDKITQIDRATCKRLRPLLNAHLATLGHQLGLNIETENATFDPAGYVTFRLRVELEGFDRERHEFEENCWQLNLEPEHYGAEFVYARDRYKLVGVKPRSPKWPIVAERVSGPQGGKRFKLPQVVVSLVKDQHRRAAEAEA